MPIDPMILDSILGTFRNMVEDCKSKNITGENFDAMTACLARMEELGQSTDDMNIFNGAMMQENLYMKFSDHYSRALSAQAQQASAEGGYDDATLLKQNLNALRDAIKRLQDNFQDMLNRASSEYVEAQNEKGLDMLGRTQKKFFDGLGGFDNAKKRIGDANKEAKKQTPNMFDSRVEVEVLNNPEPLIRGIQNVIDLGEQPGMNYPTFLRLMIETGVDKAMEGSGVMRDGLVYLHEFNEAIPANPHYVEVARRKIEAFDQLASLNRFGVPDLKELGFAHDDIDREFEPLIRKWDGTKRIWEKMLWDLYDWSLAHCEFAPAIEPWKMAKDPVAATIFDQNTIPGIFKEREKLLKKYFGMDFHDIFKHETFRFEVEKSYFWMSQELLEFLIEEVYPHCKPFTFLPGEIVEKRGQFHRYKRNPGDREMNPDLHIPNQRLRDYYNKKFGAGYYETKFQVAEKNPDCFAKPWNLSTFSYGQ